MFQIHRSVVVVGLFVTSCTPTRQGGEADSCYPNGTCDNGLTCLSGVCVVVPETDLPVAAAPTTAPVAAPAPSAAPTMPPSIPSATPPVPVPTTVQVGTPQRPTAVSAYREVVDAYNTFDRSRYFDGYAAVLTCWYNMPSVNRMGSVVDARSEHFDERTPGLIQILDLTVVAASDERAILHEVGRVVGTESVLNHEKIIALEWREDRWQIVVEVSRNRHDCFEPAAEFFERVSPATGTVREGDRGECVVMETLTQCEGEAGGPPCRTRRQALNPPPIPAGTVASEMRRYELDFEDVNCGVTPQFAPSGMIQGYTTGCMGGESSVVVYSPECY
jgi:hypothetical protein